MDALRDALSTDEPSTGVPRTTPTALVDTGITAQTGNGTTITETATTDISTYSASATRNILLPDGRVMNGTNTLESVNVATLPPPPPPLEMRSSRNHHHPYHNHSRFTATTASMTTTSNEITQHRVTVVEVHGEAIPVQPVLEAVVIHPRRRILLLLFGMCFISIVLITALVVTLYCVGGNCDGGDGGATSNHQNEESSRNDDRSNNTPAFIVTNFPITMTPASPLVAPPTSSAGVPAAVPPIITPIVPTTLFPADMLTDVPITSPSYITTRPATPQPIHEQWSVACNFLTISNVTECQTITSISTVNTLGNTIPTELGLLTQLTVLEVYSTRLTGTIPSTLGNLIQLTSLGFWNNELTGTVPSVLCSISDISLQIDCTDVNCTCCTDSNGIGCL